ncbi:MAG: Rho termination factor N-terminal domain-containing protein, partial [Acidimicrobiales bacterium]
MAIKPSPDRSDLESKSRDDLLTIAKTKGVDVTNRATKTSLIEAIMGDPAPGAPDSNGASPDSNGAAPSRAVRSRRTVATPDDDFDDLVGE